MQSTSKLLQVNEKLRKRILRSKIAKILQSNFLHYCDKFVKTEKYQAGIDMRKTEFQNEDERAMIKHHPPMRFTQEQRAKIQFLNISVPEAEEIQRKLKGLLSRQELLEIGEDPAYYLQDEELRQLNWNEEEWINRTQSAQEMPKQHIPAIKASSNLLRIKQKHYKEDDRSQKKQHLLERQQYEMKEIADFRIMRFQENQKREMEQREMINEKLGLKYRDKIQMTNKRIDAKDYGQQRKKEIQQEEYKEKSALISEYMRQQQEIEEIKMMTQKFKTLCVEKQVVEIKGKHLSQSLEKALIFNQRFEEKIGKRKEDLRVKIMTQKKSDRKEKDQFFKGVLVIHDCYQWQNTLFYNLLKASNVVKG